MKTDRYAHLNDDAEAADQDAGSGATGADTQNADERTTAKTQTEASADITTGDVDSNEDSVKIRVGDEVHEVEPGERTLEELLMDVGVAEQGLQDTDEIPVSGEADTYNRIKEQIRAHPRLVMGAAATGTVVFVVKPHLRLLKATNNMMRLFFGSND